MSASTASLGVAELGAGLTEGRARAIYRQGEEATVLALMALSKLAAGQAAGSGVSPSTPSGQRPIYTKPTTRSRRKKPGRKEGHAGSRRPVPDRIDRCEEHRCERCPHCDGPVHRCDQARTRYIEDIPEGVHVEVTQHTIHRDWCPACKKHVEPVVPDALPGASIGLRTAVMTAWLHYGLGTTIQQIIEVFGYHMQMELTPGGLVQMWHRLAEVLEPWYEQIHDQALDSAVLQGDETGWRVNGTTHWLWAFGSQHEKLTFYMVHRSRGSPALDEFFTREFSGTLVTDFWAAYNAVACGERQMCLVHLLRDLKEVEAYKRCDGDWPAFAKTLRRLIGDAMRLWKRDDVDRATYARRGLLVDQRLTALIDGPWQHADARRLTKRLRRHRDDLFTFLDTPGVPPDNNHAERMIRPAVIIRKNSHGNRSDRGAQTQAVLMSIHRTLKQRGHNPLETIVGALKTHLTTGQLPPLPSETTANG